MGKARGGCSTKRRELSRSEHRVTEPEFRMFVHKILGREWQSWSSGTRKDKHHMFF
jgi:hypothetical protein